MRCVLFDAVGTLIYPRPSVSEVYAECGRRHGSQLTQGEIKQRFGPAFEHADEARQQGQTDEANELARWQQIVAAVFTDVANSQDLFTELWQHFARSSSWALFEDVAATWELLTARGLLIGIASNFDGRLHTVCAGHPPLDRCEHRFISSELGYAKPHPQFFATITNRLGLPANEILLIGDDPQRDILGATQAGWRALQIDRSLAASTASVLCDLRHVAPWLDRL